MALRDELAEIDAELDALDIHAPTVLFDDQGRVRRSVDPDAVRRLLELDQRLNGVLGAADDEERAEAKSQIKAVASKMLAGFGVEDVDSTLEGSHDVEA